MEHFSAFWKYFVESNTFNFVFFVIIFAFIFKKINIKELIANLQKSVVDAITKSKEY